MLLGEYKHTIDSKGRIIIPVKFRDILGEKFIITKGLDNCLFLYTMEEWQALHNKIKNLPVTDASVRKFVRFFFGGAVICEADSQSRVIIPQNLREYASIIKEVVSIGVSNRAELWSKENWTSYNDSNFIDNELAMHMSNLGI